MDPSRSRLGVKVAGPGFAIGDAYRFASTHGFETESRDIRSMRVHQGIKKRHVPRKGAFVELFENRGTMDEFVLKYWPARNTEPGTLRRQLYLDLKSQNETLLLEEALVDVDKSVHTHIAPPKTFRGFVWEPSDEQEVVILFGRLLDLDRLGTPLCLERARTTFPDCTAINPETGETIRIEFEYRSSSFICHRKEWNELKTAHPSEHWWVVCWHDDLDEKSKNALTDLRLVSLRDIARDLDLVQNWYDGDPNDKNYAKKFFDWRASALSTDHREVIRRLRSFGLSEPGFKVQWPSRPAFPKFTVWSVHKKIRCFIVSADGTISIPFSKWRTSALMKKEAIGLLNKALRTERFTNREKKKKGCDAAGLLCDSDAIDRFLDVWRSLSHQPIPAEEVGA
jgi:hypothetical protein